MSTPAPFSCVMGPTEAIHPAPEHARDSYYASVGRKSPTVVSVAIRPTRPLVESLPRMNRRRARANSRCDCFRGTGVVLGGARGERCAHSTRRHPQNAYIVINSPSLTPRGIPKIGHRQPALRASQPPPCRSTLQARRPSRSPDASSRALPGGMNLA